MIVLLFVIVSYGMADIIHVPADQPTIQDGISVAAEGDVVLVAPGTYVENISFMGKAITVKSSDGPGLTVVDGNNSGCVVSFVNGEGFDSILEGFTVQNGNRPSDNGGGILCSGSEPTIVNNIIQNNYAHNGGGVFCWLKSPRINNNIIQNNSADWGGGVCCWDDSSPLISENEIIGNSAMGGGGIYCQYNTYPSIMNNNISQNTAQDGAGIYCTLSTPEISDNEISSNVSHRHGGGLLLYSGSCGSITNNNIENNVSSNSGGGILCSIDSSPLMINNKMIYNESMYGGGICCLQNSSPDIGSNTIGWNTASNYGGGIYCYDHCSPSIYNNIIVYNSADKPGVGVGGGVCLNYSTVTVTDLVNNTICWNSATKHGGGVYIYQGALTSIVNTILWENTCGITGYNLWIGSTSQYTSVVDVSYSDIGGGNNEPYVYVDALSVLIWGPGMIDEDPLFVTGPEGDYYLSQIAAGQLYDSPCVDAGDQPSMNHAMHVCWTRTDEVGDAGIVDMGFHYGPYIMPSLTVDGYEIPESTGGTIVYSLNAGKNKADRKYILLGGVTGIEPGFPLPGGNATIPVNWDVFTEYIVLPLINTSIFSNFLSTLDADGMGTAHFNAPPVVGYAGLKMYYAYCLGWPWEFASNPVEIEVVP